MSLVNGLSWMVMDLIQEIFGIKLNRTMMLPQVLILLNVNLELLLIMIL